MITLDGNGILFDIQMGTQSLTDDFVKRTNFQCFAFRLVYTAGIALPTIEFIVACSDLSYLEKFTAENTPTIFVGSDPEHMDSFEMDIVGHHLKNVSDLEIPVLTCGGVLKNGKFNSMILKDQLDETHKGKALDVIRDVWSQNVGTPIDYNILEDHGAEREYKRNKRTLQEYLADIWLSIDSRPSFPMMTLGRHGELVLRDFQTLKKVGPTATFAPSNPRTLKPNEVPYNGKAESVSYKTYTNRKLGYTQLTFKDSKTGEVKTLASSMRNAYEGWGQNTLSTSQANEQPLVEHRSGDIQNLTVDDTTTAEYHLARLHNKNCLINMSSIQTKVRVEGRYLNWVNVLDLVKLDTKKVEDRISGLYIVEAIEQGFVYGAPFANLVYMCRDNDNDVEKNTIDKYSKNAMEWLTIPPDIKASIINATRTSRNALINTRGFLSGQYQKEWQALLIGLKTSAISNFSLFDTNVNLSSQTAIVRSFENAASSLVSKFLSEHVPPPFRNVLMGLGFSGAGIYNVLLTILSALFGADLFDAFSVLFSDLKNFAMFLSNYKKNVQTAQNYNNKSFIKQFIEGEIVFKENSLGDIIVDDISSILGDTVVKADTAITEEDKSGIITNIITSLMRQVPSSVDLPIPEISISDSEAIKPTEELKEDIAGIIVEDLVDKGYVYDDRELDPSEIAPTKVIKADGTELTMAEAKQQMVASSKLKDMLLGRTPFDVASANKINAAPGEIIYARHWGTFSDFDDLTSFKILAGFAEKYKSLNTTKRMSVLQGRKIFVALPAKEHDVKFYINSTQTTFDSMDIDGLGYTDNRGREIPYTIYFSTEGYNSNNLLVEIRRA